MTPGNKNLPITYREYKFAEEFPILLMEGKSTSPQIDFIHFHNCIEIAFCRKGTMTWNLENRIFSLTPGNICFLPPFFTHGSFFPVLPEAAPKETVPKETAPKEDGLKVVFSEAKGFSEANISPGTDTTEDAPDTDVSCVYLFFNPEQLLAPFYPNGLPREFTWYQYTDFPKILPAALFPEQVKLIRMIIQELQEKKRTLPAVRPGYGGNPSYPALQTASGLSCFRRNGFRTSSAVSCRIFSGYRICFGA